MKTVDSQCKELLNEIWERINSHKDVLKKIAQNDISSQQYHRYEEAAFIFMRIVHHLCSDVELTKEQREFVNIMTIWDDSSLEDIL